MRTNSLGMAGRSIVVTPALVLYVTAWLAGVLLLYVVWPMLGIRAETYQQYYLELGNVTRVWGYVVGVALGAILLALVLRYLLAGSLRSLTVRLSRIEIVLWLLFLANLLWAIVGFLAGNPLSYLLGDTLKGLMFPAIYWIVKEGLADGRAALFLTKVVLWGETILLCILIPTQYIPFSQGGRTFLSTVFFTLIFEETRASKRILYLLLLLFGIYAMFTTAAVRGIMIIFVLVIVLNYIFRLRPMQFRTAFFAFIIPPLMLLVADSVFDLRLDTYVEWTQKRFSGSVSRERKLFGLDESLAQRVTETIDVGSSFSRSSPVFLATGFGNGAMLTNTLITPVEYAVYKSNTKHHIYITMVAVLFRNGLIGLILYGAIAFYIIRILFRLRAEREILRLHQRFIYLKVLTLYQVSVLVMSFIAYWYVGNIIIAFTLPLIEYFRRDMETTVREAKANRTA
jgi:hypothetical protein